MREASESVAIGRAVLEALANTSRCFPEGGRSHSTSQQHAHTVKQHVPSCTLEIQTTTYRRASRLTLAAGHTHIGMSSILISHLVTTFLHPGY